VLLHYQFLTDNATAPLKNVILVTVFFNTAHFLPIKGLLIRIVKEKF
jgi:hypothetical protein